MLSRVIVWLRNDLRLKDNYALFWAVKHQAKGKQVLPVFCFDPRIYCEKESKTKYGTRKTGLIRSQFQLESVECLRKNLKAIGSELLVSMEKPEIFIPKLISKDHRNVVVYQQEICDEELRVER